MGDAIADDDLAGLPSELSKVMERGIGRALVPGRGQEPLKIETLRRVVEIQQPGLYQRDPTGALKKVIGDAIGLLRKESFEPGAPMIWQELAERLYNMTGATLTHVTGQQYSYLLEQTFSGPGLEHISKRTRRRVVSRLRTQLSEAIKIMMEEDAGHDRSAAVEHTSGAEDQPSIAGATLAVDIPANRQHLVGRGMALKRLDDSLRDFRVGNVSGIVNVSGSPGMGKTALAKTWAAQVDGLGSFPDGYFAIDFHGYSSQRLGPGEAAEQLLADMGVKDIPASPSGRTRQLALRLSARRFLVLFDNVFTENDVRELLPEKLSSFVIVTSRKELEGLSVSHGMDLVRLSKLKREDAEYFITKSAGESRTDMEAVGRIAKICCDLPLALKVVTRRLETDAGLTLAKMADDLEWEDGRLQALETSDKATSPSAVFATSYRQLTSAEKQVFRLLGLRSSQANDTYAVSLIGDCDMRSAGSMVRSLKGVGLIEGGRGRFEMHDLIHEFAGQLCEEHDSLDLQRAVLERLATSYYDCVNYAFNEKNPSNPMVDASAVKHLLEQPRQPGKQAVDRYSKGPEADSSNPARWFEAERANLVDLVKRACAFEPPIKQAAQLAFSLFYFLEAGSHWTDWQAVNDAGYALACRMDTHDGRAAQAGLLRNMGRWHFVQVRDLQDALHDESVSCPVVDVLAACRQAIEYFEQSFQTYQELCAAQPQPGVLLSRAAVVRRELADATLAQAKLDLKPESFTQALNAFLEVKELFKGFDDSPGRSNALASLDVSLSEVYRQLKEQKGFVAAKECLETALAFAGKRKPDGSYNHPRTKGYAELRYAELEMARKNTQAALDRFGNAIEDFREDDNEIAEARALARKGRLLAKLSRSSEAASEFEKSLDILMRLESSEADVVRVWLQQVSGRKMRVR